MARRHYTVTAGGRTTTFNSMAEALDFVQLWLERAQRVRELSARCE